MSEPDVSQSPDQGERLHGGRILILGGSSGIGLATARLAAARGATIMIAARTTSRLSAALALDPRLVGLAADARDPSSIARLYDAIGRFDHLVLAFSGGRGAGPLAKLSEADLRSAFEAKFWAYWRAAKLDLAHLTFAGSIVFVSAASARGGMPNVSGLAAVNGAINALAAPLAREFAPRRVDVVAPRCHRHPLVGDQAEVFRRVVFENAAAELPAQRVGRAEDVAEAVLFLIENSFTTGVVLDVDGGQRARTGLSRTPPSPVFRPAQTDRTAHDDEHHRR